VGQRIGMVLRTRCRRRRPQRVTAGSPSQKVQQPDMAPQHAVFAVRDQGVEDAVS
jgi:hypothetical protein